MMCFGEASSSDIDKALLAMDNCDKRNNATACAGVGSIYYFSKKFEEALYYYKKACDGGSLNGCSQYAMMHMVGDGVPKNYAVALKYYKMACDGGYFPTECAFVGTIYHGARGEMQDTTQALKYYKKACDLNDKLGCDGYNALMRTK
jgi:TPR repeat protein